MRLIGGILAVGCLVAMSVMTFIILPRHKDDQEAVNRIFGRFLILLCPLILLGLVLAILSE